MKGKRLLKIKTIIDTYGIYNSIEFFVAVLLILIGFALG